MNSSKKHILRNQSEMPRHFAALAAQDDRLKNLVLDSEEHPTIAKFKLDGKTHRFALKFLTTPTIADVPDAEFDASTHPMLVVPRLSPVFLRACQEKRISILDLNGQGWLRAPDLLVSLPSLPDRNFRFAQAPRNVFVGKSARIVRTLLSDSKRIWRQNELIQRTGATSGLVSRIVTHLTQQEFLRKTDARRFQVVSPASLLDAWAQADDFSRRAVTWRFSVLNADSVALAKTIKQVFARDNRQFAFTQWLAAWLRHPYTEPPIVSLYVAQLPAQKLLDELGFRQVSEAGRVWLHIPTDDGVFRETQSIQGLPLVSDAQIYLDLLKTGLRGPEQAQALREWSGFCLP